MKKQILPIVVIGTFLFLAFSLRPVDKSKNNSITIEGKVELIEENEGKGDIHIVLANNQVYYYINRGKQKGLNAYLLHETLQGKKVTLSFANHFTPLDPFNTHKHVTELIWKEKVLYSEY